MNNKKGYQVTTYRSRIYCSQKEWLWNTKEIYNFVLEFYYEILKNEFKLEVLNQWEIMRQLELWTIGNQRKEGIRYPFPFGKVPLYFRRAAISDAIRLYRSYKEGEKRNSSVKPAGHFFTSPIFYKGMYKEFSQEGISLKLWTGERWVWTKCSLDTFGRKWPEGSAILSPVLKLEGKRAMLHIPVRQEVADVRTVQERFAVDVILCSSAFPNNDCMAVLTILGRDGRYRCSRFIRGGSQFACEKKKLLNRIRKNQESMGGKARKPQERENEYLKEKLKNLSENYAHQVSRQIVDFCEEQRVNILVVPGYGMPMNLNQIGYLSAASYDWIGRKIIQYVRYKAFGKGIIVTSVSTKDMAAVCYICGEQIKRFNKKNRPGKNYYGGKNYICPNGHRGNAYFNSAMNVGRRFLKSQAEMQG